MAYAIGFFHIELPEAGEPGEREGGVLRQVGRGFHVLRGRLIRPLRGALGDGLIYPGCRTLPERTPIRERLARIKHFRSLRRSACWSG